MELSALLTNTTTGDVRENQIKIVGEPDWTRAAGGAGQVSATLQLDPDDWTPDDVEMLVERRRTTMTIEQVRFMGFGSDPRGTLGRPIASGVIIGHDYDPRTGQLSLRGVDGPWLMARGRPLWDLGTFNLTARRKWSATSTWAGLAIAAAKRGWTELSLRSRLPIEFPATPSGTETLEVFEYELRNLLDIFEECEDAGVTIDFLPTYPGSGLEYEMRASLGALDSPKDVFDVVLSTRSGIQGEAEWERVRGEVSDWATGAAWRGEGKEWGTLIGVAIEADVGITSGDWPHFNVVDSDTGMKRQRTVDRSALNLLSRQPETRSRDLRVWCSDELPASDFQPGQQIRVIDADGDAYSAAVNQLYRVVSQRYDGESQIVVEVEKV